MRHRALVVGCGGIADAWLTTQTVRDRVEVVGLCDLRPGAAEALRTKHGYQAACGSDLAALVRQTSPTLVFNLTIPGAHEATSITAMEHGCHVLTEKPMADTLPAAQRMVAVARRTGRTLAVIQNRRFFDGIRRLKAFLDSGAIGRVVDVHADFFIAAHFGGFRETMEHVLLVDMAIHSFDQGRFLAGRRPLAATAMEWNPPGSNYRHGAAALVGFELSDGGVLTYRGSWTATGAQTTWECHWRIQGSSGAVTWDGAEAYHAEGLAVPDEPSAERGGPLIRSLKPIGVPTIAPLAHGGHDGVIADVLDAIEAGRDPETVGHDNLHSVAMVCAAVESATTGRRVEIATAKQAAQQ